jgi:hypothetical protein
MKRILNVFMAALLVVTGSSALSVPVFSQSADPIPSIRKQYAAINKRAAGYRKVKKQLSGFSLEGGELLAYLDRGAIVKITARHFGEGGNTVEEYYYGNGKLIFVFERVSHYNQPLSGKVVRTIENRYYFNNDDLIRWIYGKGNAVSHDADYRLKEKELLEHSNKFLAGARSSERIVEGSN